MARSRRGRRVNKILNFIIDREKYISLITSATIWDCLGDISRFSRMIYKSLRITATVAQITVNQNVEVLRTSSHS
jgi:hypothetical protein